MRAYFKTILRTFKSNLARFFAIAAIVCLGICFVTGIGAVSPKIIESFAADLREKEVADVVVKSKSFMGFSVAELASFNNFESVEDAFSLSAFEMTVGGKNTRIYLVDINEMRFNHLKLVSGSFPINGGDCVVERGSDTLHDVAIGEEFRLMDMDIKVGGIVENPMIFARDGEQSMTGSAPIEMIIYADATMFQFDFKIPVTDVYLKLKGAESETIFSSGYKKLVNRAVSEMKSHEKYADNFVFLSLEENKSAALLESVTDKINVISLVFPVFFILVVGLVVLTTVTRLAEEERAVIGCLKTLGYSNFKIILKYFLFATVSCCVGICAGLAVGAYLLPSVICPAFEAVFFMPQLASGVQIGFGAVSSLIMFVAVAAISVFVLKKTLSDVPQALLKAKSPKPGKKIFLERIPPIWRRLSFRYKSTLRNIFRYKGRLAMIVIAVAGATALVMAGFGLRDVSIGGDEVAGVLKGMKDTISLISYVIIVFAALLSVLVIYNLTNMNIGERRREIATLKVLGYRDTEVGGYIFREIVIMALIGVLIGVPVGVGVLAFVFHYLDFGTMAGIMWYSYLLPVPVIMLSIALVNAVLYPKIKREDMNASLKSIE